MDDATTIEQRKLNKEMATVEAGKEIKANTNDVIDASVETELEQYFVQSIQVTAPLKASNDLDPTHSTDGSVSPYPSSSPTIDSPTMSPSFEPRFSLKKQSNPSTLPPSNIPTVMVSEQPPIVESELISFSGTIWNDKNGNGRIDDLEEGLAGVIVQVKSCTTDQTEENANDRTVAFAFTNSDGSYLMKNIGPPGCYYVHLVRSDMGEGGQSQKLFLESGGSVSLNAGITLPTTLIPTVASSTIMPSVSVLTSEPSNSPTSSEPTIIPSESPTTSKPSSKPTFLKCGVTFLFKPSLLWLVSKLFSNFHCFPVN